MRIELQMEKTKRKTDYSAGFTYAIILCSMLLMFPFRLGGMEALPVILFSLCIVWMATDIWQIHRRKRRIRLNYRRLDIAVVMLLVYELGMIAVSMMQEIGENEPEPDYSWKLMMISMALLYLLAMETETFRVGYLDMILYGGLAVMSVLLLGYLFDPQIGGILRLWEDCTAAASYLIMVGIVGALQYCRCEERMRRVFYAMCTGVAIFLLACNHSVISFWIMVYAILSIPVLIRPTADLCKRAMQILFFFLVLISSMGLLANKTSLLLTEVSYDAAHSVCLEMTAAVGGLVFFYCWYRKPEGMSQKKIVMKGFYKLDKLVLWGGLIIFVLFVSGGAAWKTLEGDGFGFRGVSGFAVPLIEEVERNRSLIYLCMQEQGVVGAVLCIGVVALVMERINRAFGWDKPMKGMLCVIMVSLLPQVLLWEIVPNILPVAVILLSGIIGCGKKKERTIGEERAEREVPEQEEADAEVKSKEETEAEEIKTKEAEAEEIKTKETETEEIKTEETGAEGIEAEEIKSIKLKSEEIKIKEIKIEEIEEIEIEEIEPEEIRPDMQKRKVAKKKEGTGRKGGKRKKSSAKTGRGRMRR